MAKKVIKLTESDLNRLVKKVINEGFVPAYTKDQAMAAFKQAQNQSGTVYLDSSINEIIFQVGSRKFYIKELSSNQAPQSQQTSAQTVQQPTGNTM